MVRASKKLGEFDLKVLIKTIFDFKVLPKLYLYYET